MISLGLNLWSTTILARGGGGEAPFSPASLFASGEEGAWYEPSITTAFTDTGGTVAATYGQPVAYLQDLSGNGNHATQTSAPSRPILARVPETGRRNLLERTEEFDDDTYWTLDNLGATNPVVTADAGLDPNGSLTADRIQLDKTGGQYSRLEHSFSATPLPSQRYTFSVWMKTYSGIGTQNVGLRLFAQASNFVVTGTWQRFTLTSGTNLTQPDCQIMLFDSIAGNDETADILVWGAQLDAGSTATAYQKVVTSYDITEAGVTSLEYLSFDGTDDGMASAAIDFTSTDKMSVFAGVRKVTDTTGLNASVIVESSAAASSNDGAFFLIGRNGFAPAAQYQIGSKGTIFVSAQTNDAAFAAPTTNVVTGFGDISGDAATLRVDGTQVAQNTSDQGTGNYLSYPLNIGARDAAGSDSLWFDGHLYGLIVRGASSTTDEITNTEAYLATRSGVTL